MTTFGAPSGGRRAAAATTASTRRACARRLPRTAVIPIPLDELPARRRPYATMAVARLARRHGRAGGGDRGRPRRRVVGGPGCTAATWPSPTGSTSPTGGGCSPRRTADPPPGFFTTEAAGLTWLREPGVVAVPEVLAVSDATTTPAHPRARVDRRGPARGHDRGRPRAAARRACTGPARRASGARTGAPPAAAACPTSRAATWAEFYATQRLLPLARLARDGGALPDRRHRRPRAARRAALDRGRRPPTSRRPGCTATCGPATASSTADGRSWLIDPAAHGGHREFDLAMMRLFGGFGADCFAAYEEALPLAAAGQERVAAAPDRPARRARHQVRRRLRPRRHRGHRPLHRAAPPPPLVRRSQMVAARPRRRGSWSSAVDPPT